MVKAKDWTIKITSHHGYRTKNIGDYQAIKFGNKKCWKISIREVLGL